MEVHIFNPSKKRDLSVDKMCKTWEWGAGMPLPRVGEWINCGGWWRGVVESIRWDMRYGQPRVNIFLARPKISRGKL